MDSWYNLGPWACTMKPCDVRTNPGLMCGHGLIRGWAHPRDSTVILLRKVHHQKCLLLQYSKLSYSEFDDNIVSHCPCPCLNSYKIDPL